MRRRWGNSVMCHTHSGSQQQWISNILSSSGTYVNDTQERTSSKKPRAKTKRTDPNGGAGSKSVQTVRTRNVNAFLQQTSPVQSEMQRLPGQFLMSPPELNAPMLPEVYGAQLQHLYAQRQLMQHKAAAGTLPQVPAAAAAALYRGHPACMLLGMVPAQAMSMASQPVGMLQSGNVPGTVRGVGSDGDVSVFRLTPGHNGRRDGGGEGEPCQHPSSAGQEARSWHTPHSATSAPDSIQDLLAKHPRPAIDSETMEDSVKKDDPSDRLWQADSCALDLCQGLDLSLAQPQELSANQQQQQQNHEKGNVDSVPGRSHASQVDDDVITDADEDVLFIGVGRIEKPKVGVNMGKHVLVSPVSDKHPSVTLSVEGSGECSDSDDDDCIVLDLSMESPPVEDNAEHQDGHMDKEIGNSLAEQDSQAERRSSVQLIEVSAETEEPSEIQVLETVSLSEQPSTDLQECDDRAKTYSQMSTESYYRCGCVKGACGFHTVLPTQLELHLQECHQYDVLYPCVHCGSQEVGIDSLMSHLEQHLTPQELLLHCSDMSCTYTSFSQGEILCHIGKYHPCQNSHTCGKCRHIFDSLYEYASHMKTNCLSVVRCQYCSAKDVDRQAILMHMASSHPDQSHTVTVQKILICQERRRNHWSTADYNAEELDGLKEYEGLVADSSSRPAHSATQGQALRMAGTGNVLSARSNVTDEQISIVSPMTSTTPHGQPSTEDGPDTQELLPTADDAQSPPSSGVGQTEEETTTNTEESVDSSCRKRPIPKSLVDGGGNITPPACKRGSKIMKVGQSLAGQSVHLVSQTDLSKSCNLSAGKESAVAEIAVNILDRGRKRSSIQEEMKEKENTEHAHTTGEDSEEEGDVSMEADIGSWIDTTCYEIEEGKVRCCICDHESCFIENHARHVHGSHNSLFKGFACERCNFLSIDRDTQAEHRCWGSHRLRSRSRVMYNEDDGDSVPWNGAAHMLSDMNSASGTQSTASKTEDRIKMRSSNKRARPLESSSPQLEERNQDVDHVDNLPLSKRAKLSEKETGCAAQGETEQSRRGELVCKTKTPKSPKVGCASGAESGGSRGVQLQCKLYGLKGTSRSGMQQHVYTDHPHDVACPLCSENMHSDRQLRMHLMDLHANQRSNFDNVKSQNFISLISGGRDDTSRKRDEGGCGPSDEGGQVERLSSDEGGHEERLPSDEGGHEERLPSDEGGHEERLPSDEGGHEERLPSDEGGQVERLPGDEGGHEERLSSDEGGHEERLSSDEGGQVERLPSDEGGHEERLPSDEGGQVERLPGDEGGHEERLSSDEGGHEERLSSDEGGHEERLSSDEGGQVERLPSDEGGHEERLSSDQGGQVERLPSDEGGHEERLSSDEGGHEERLSSDEGGQVERLPGDEGGHEERLSSDEGGHEERLSSDEGGHEERLSSDEGGQVERLPDDEGGHEERLSSDEGGPVERLSDDEGGHEERLSSDEGGHEERLSSDEGGHVERLPDDEGGHVERLPDDEGGQVERLSDDEGGHQERLSSDEGGHVERLPDDEGGQVERLPDDEGGHEERLPDDEGGHEERLSSDEGGQVERLPEATGNGGAVVDNRHEHAGDASQQDQEPQISQNKTKEHETMACKVCRLCGYSGSDWDDLHNHVYTDHKEVMTCPLCGLQLTTDQELDQHLTEKHPGDKSVPYTFHRYTNWVYQPSDSQERLSLKGGRCPFHCRLCFFSAKSKPLIVKHVMRNHLGLECPACSWTGHSLQALCNHISREHAGEKEVLTEVCRSKPGNWYVTLSPPAASTRTTRKRKQWVTSSAANQPMFLRIRKESAPGKGSTHSRLQVTEKHEGTGNAGAVKDKGTGNAGAVEDKGTGNAGGVKNKGNGNAAVKNEGNGNAAVKIEWNGNSASTSSSTASETPHLPPPSDSSAAVPTIPDAEASFDISLKGQVLFLSNCADISLSVPLMSQEQYEALAALEVNNCMEFRCRHCTSNFKWRYRFYEHLCYHYHYRCFQCAHCLFLAFSGSAVVNHSKRTHDQEPSVLHLSKPTYERRIERVISEAYVPVTEPYTTQRLMAYERVRLRKMSKRESVLQKKGTKSSNKIKISTETRKKVPANKKKFLSKKTKTTKIKAPKKWRKVVNNGASHSEAHEDGKTEWLRCPYCRGAKKRRPVIESEIRYHIHYKPFRCSYCEFTSGSEQCSLRHTAKTHPGNNITVNYERIEHKEVRFTDLLSRAMKLSKQAVKGPVTSKVKRKYMKKKVSESGTAAARSEVGGGTREEEEEADHLQPASATQDIHCAQRNAVSSHTLECDQSLLTERGLPLLPRSPHQTKGRTFPLRPVTKAGRKSSASVSDSLPDIADADTPPLLSREKTDEGNASSLLHPEDTEITSPPLLSRENTDEG